MEQKTVEQEIQEKGLNAPRVTPESIEAAIVAEYNFTADKAVGGAPIHESLPLLSICVLVLRNGYTVVGKSACASPENFDADIGHRVAREDAKRQVWALEGYALRNKLTA